NWSPLDLTPDTVVDQEVAYDSRSLVIREKDDIGRVTVIDYDAAGREKARTLPVVSGVRQPNVIVKKYEEGVKLTSEILNERSKDPNNVEVDDKFVTAWEYDALNQKTKETKQPGDALEIHTTFKYSSLGNLIETWNPNDVGTHTYFDSLNRPVVTRT